MRAAQPLPWRELSGSSSVATSLSKDRSNGVDPPIGTVDVTLSKDVYATAFALANNATPALYSCAPWRNPKMALVWFYLLFIAFTQAYVLASMLVINPPVVDTQTVFVDCERGTPSLAAVAALSPDDCVQLDIVFELPAASASRAEPVILRRLELPTYYYMNMLTGDAQHTFLQVVCCVWVTVQVYYVDFQNVASLLRFRDFIRWLQPQKGESLRSNSWVMLIPMLQFALGLLVVLVSCTVTCGTEEPFDVVLNSLAFTFISQV